MQYLYLHFPKYYLFALSDYSTQADSLAVFSASPEKPDATIATPGQSGPVMPTRPAHEQPSVVYSVGDYVVGDAEDTLLNGHPDIRY